MPMYESEESAAHRQARRQEIKQKLLRKGLVEGTNKFGEVYYRELGKRGLLGNY